MAAAYIALFVILWRRTAKMNSPTDRREASVFKLYEEIESMLDSFEDYVREVHEGFEAERARLDELFRQVSLLHGQLGERVPISYVPPPVSAPEARPAEPAAEPTAPPPSRLSQKDRDTLDKMGKKSQKVRFLMSRGLSLDEVARELGIGKGEVRLIADLEKN